MGSDEAFNTVVKQNGAAAHFDTPLAVTCFIIALLRYFIHKI
jgi:hypothetical protein